MCLHDVASCSAFWWPALFLKNQTEFPRGSNGTWFLGTKSSTKCCYFLIFQIHIYWYEISLNSTGILHRVAVGFCTSLEHRYSHPDYNHWSSAYPMSVWSSLALIIYHHLQKVFSKLWIEPTTSLLCSCSIHVCLYHSISIIHYINCFCLWSVSILDCELLNCKAYVLPTSSTMSCTK